MAEIAIEAKDLVFGYSRNANIINQVSLSLYKGETVALVGPNGAGKTTLGKLVTGILQPVSGQLWLFGKDASHMPLHHIGQKIGYCFQNPEHQLLTMSVKEEIAFALKYRGVAQDQIERVVEQLLSLLELEHLRDSLPLNLSWGEKRRVVLAACLALEPEYLVLDEPTIGLDEEKIKIFNGILKRLRQAGIGMLLISHNKRFVEENAQRLIAMEGGKIVDDRCR